MSLPAPPPEPEWATREDRSPDLSGLRGRGWRVTAPQDENDPRVAVHIGSWLVHAPASHPWWPWYLVAAVALREMPGVPAPNRSFEGAEYELLVLALDPRQPVPDPAAQPGEWPTLSPPDQVHQFPKLPQGDSHMRDILELTVLAIVDGRLVPDQDHRPAWRNSMAHTIDHFVRGEHGT